MKHQAEIYFQTATETTHLSLVRELLAKVGNSWLNIRYSLCLQSSYSELFHN